MTVSTRAKVEVPIGKLEVKTYKIPTELPESDGTLEWDSTTLVAVHVYADNTVGFGYTYSDAGAAEVIASKLKQVIVGKDAMAISRCWKTMAGELRNLGDSGITMMAVAAVDNALWDLKAKLLDIPLVTLLGQVRESVPVYGSGGFTSYTMEQLTDQLSEWSLQGMFAVKMKIGTNPEEDPARIRAARQAIGPKTNLFVDANGAYDRKQALLMAEFMSQYNVIWFEEPVWHRDLEGLHLLRDRAPACMDIAAGEYGFELAYFRGLVESDSVDILQADATRCGISTLLRLAALCEMHHIPLSTHTAPAIHVHAACALEPVRHIEYFHDHVRIETMLFEGLPYLKDGKLEPDLSRPGMGIELKEAEARRFEIPGF
jgi:L-alanine-DL-glutamate epimerase-like enolase superfamily enzyme